MNNSPFYYELQNTLDKVTAVALAKSEPDVVALIDLAVADNGAIGFRAGWVLEQVYRHNLPGFLPHTSYFLDQLERVTNLSAQRSFTTILCLATTEKKIADFRPFLTPAGTDYLIEVLFGWLVEPSTPVAVKANCMEVLANVIPPGSNLKVELIETIDYLCNIESVAFFGRAKKVLPKLRKK